MPTIYEKLDIPEESRSTSIHPTEGEFIRDFLAARNVTATLETGFAYGCSAAYIMAASSAPHVAVEPSTEYGDYGARNMKKLGFTKRLEIVREPSITALPALAARGATFDFFFIDGGHRFEELFIDWCYANLLVKPGGHVLFHDRWLKSTQYAATFIRNNRPDWREIPTRLANLYLFEKVEAPLGNWWVMNDFGAEGRYAPPSRAAAAARRPARPRAAGLPSHLAYRIPGATQ